MKKQLLVLGLVALSALTLSGCSDATMKALKDLPDKMCAKLTEQMAAARATPVVTVGDQDTKDFKIKDIQSQIDAMKCNQ